MASSDASQLAGAPAPQEEPPSSAGSARTTGAATQRPAGSGSAGPVEATGEDTLHLDRSVPGATKETNAALIMEILNDEANGKHCIPTVGRADGGWCRRQFLKTVSGAGQESWNFFKATYKRRIDYSPDWQWVRVGQGQEIDPFGAAKQD